MGNKKSTRRTRFPQPKRRTLCNSENTHSMNDTDKRNNNSLISEVRVQLMSERNFNSRSIYIRDCKSKIEANARMLIIENHKLIQTISTVNKKLIDRSRKGEVDLSGDAF